MRSPPPPGPPPWFLPLCRFVSRWPYGITRTLEPGGWLEGSHSWNLRRGEFKKPANPRAEATNCSSSGLAARRARAPTAGQPDSNSNYKFTKYVHIYTHVCMSVYINNINYYLFAWAHVIDATYVNRRVGAMQPYAEK